MRAVFLLAMGLVLASAAPIRSPSQSPRPNPGSPEDLRTCGARGGKIEIRGGLSPAPMCAISYPDAGRACTDSSQCGGRCMAAYERGPRLPSVVAGQCERGKLSLSNCYAELRGGRPGPVICGD